MKKNLLTAIITTITFASFSPVDKGKVTVAVAANMQYAMNALKDKFENETGIKVEVILSSSTHTTDTGRRSIRCFCVGRHKVSGRTLQKQNGHRISKSVRKRVACIVDFQDGSKTQS